jgi:hypothetical protein
VHMAARGERGPDATAMVRGRAVKWSRGAERERERESWLPYGPGRGVGLSCNEREPTDMQAQPRKTND